MNLFTTSWIVDLILLVTPLLVYVLYKFRKRYNYFKDRGMPYHDVGIFNIINWNVLLMRETIEDSLDRIYKKNSEHKYVGLPTIFSKSILLIDPELIEKVLIKDFSHFHDRLNVEIDPESNPLGSNIFNLRGKMWNILRAKLSPTFTSGKLKGMYNQIAMCTDILIENLEKEANGDDFLIRDFISRYGLDVIASCAFGLEANAQRNPDSEFRRQAAELFKPKVLFMIKETFRFLFPKFAKKIKLPTFAPEINDFFFELTKQTIKQREENGTTRNDFIQLLMQLKDKGYVEYDANEANEVENPEEALEKFEFTDQVLASQVFVFFMAGFEPVSTLINFALYELSNNDEIQNKVREEVKKAKEKHGGITYDALKDMTYLDCVMAETLRIHPPAAAMFRVCTKSYKMDDGKTIEKDVMVMIPSYSLHHDPKYFPMPKVFKPERFEDGEQLSIRQGHGIYIPFGDGPRVCIARRFALLEAKLALSRIVETYQLRKSLKNVEPIRRDPKSFVIQPIGGMWIRMEKLVE